MKFTVEVEEFWLEEKELEKGLQDYVIKDVIIQINEAMKKKIEEQITMRVKEEVEKTMYRRINAIIEETIKTEDVFVRQGETIKIVDYIKKQFLDNSGWSNPTETIKKLAKEFGQELKNRYDLMFASQIVAKMNENGLLKEGAAKYLLEDKKE